MSVKILNILKFLRPTSRLPQRFSSRYVDPFDSFPNKYGGKTNITVLPGTGIGPEIMESTLEILKAAEAPLSYEILSLPPVPDQDEEDKGFQNALISIRRNRIALKGNIELKSKNPYAQSRNIMLRKTLDLYVYVLWCKTFPGLKNLFGSMDTIVIRQNTEGEYLMLEHEPRSGSVESLKIITRNASERMAEFAFQFALKNNRKHVTIAHNADIQNFSEGLFVDAALTVSKKYPSISSSVKEVGVLCSKIILNPREFDMILTTNLNGSMISNLLIGMLGGPGLTAGTNLGEDGIAVFEPGARNKGSSIVGTGSANPVAMILAATNLLNHLGNQKTAQLLHQAVFSTLVSDRVLTRDLGGKATTKQITENVIRHVKRQLDSKVTHRANLLRHTWKSYCDIPENDLPKLQFPKQR